MAKRFHRRFIQAGGVRTCLLEAGEPGSTVVMLVHDGAYGTDAELCWAGVIPELADEYHIIAPDLIGWGGTDKLCYFDRSPYDFRLDHLASICHVLALDDPVFYVGSSFGAELVVRGVAESRWGWAPRAAIAVAGTGGRLYRMPGAIEQLSDYTPSLEAARKLTALLVSSIESLDDHISQRFNNSMIAGHWESLSALKVRNPSAEAPEVTDTWPEPLHDLDVPLLFVEGQDDPLLEKGWAAKMAGLSDSFSSVVVPGGHEPNIEHPAATGRLIREYFAKH